MQSIGFLTTPYISLVLRNKTVEAHDKKEGYTAISKHFTVSRTAVRCIFAKHKETNSVRNKPWRGRKRKISKTLERKIIRDVSKKPQTSAKMTVADLELMFQGTQLWGLFFVVGFRVIVPEEPLYSKSGTSLPDRGLPVNIRRERWVFEVCALVWWD